ncbi:CoA-binding protein [Maridesulfovibrio sp.]|uniref:CoA-binding protein n=1 Tax=Maridesulfovibrio sp. TaxID=2795000 RepID=UPI002A18BCE3|nr:CoA-binding protein [Maridesulfovibrio sp.]
MLIVDEKKLAALLDEVKVIAVIGAVDKPGRPVDRVCRYMIDAGYEIIPVHPKRENVWGLKTYKSVKDIPVAVDLVNLFRASEFCADHAREVLELETLPKCFWMQQDIFSPEARELFSGKDITVIEDRCIMVDHKNLAGNK